MMTRPRLGLIGLATLATLGLVPPVSAADKPRLESLRTDGLRAESVDAGDAYATPNGRRALRRLAGAVAVELPEPAQRPAVLSRLAAADGPLPGYTVDAEPREGLAIFRAARSERQRQIKDPARLRQQMASARQAPGVRAANPVFLDPTSGLWLVAGSEMIICLQPGVDAREYFGADWPKVRPLRGALRQFVLRLGTSSAEELLAEVDRRMADPRVAWAEPDFIGQAVKQTSDPLLPFQWPLANAGLNGSVAGADIQAPPVWAVTTGSSNVVVAVLDDGLQLDHPDLAANLFRNPGETLNGLDDDHNGYVDDLHGWDFLANNGDPSPKHMEDVHGTTVAGIAGAVGNNAQGVASVAYGGRLLPVKIMTGPSIASHSQIAEAVYYAAGRSRDGTGTWRGADVLSISLSFSPSTVVSEALAWATRHGRNGKGCAIFCAAGNGASRWMSARVRLPVAAFLEPGQYRFGFEYAKDPSDTVGEDLVRVDNVALLGADGVTILNSALGPNGRQDFEGAQFPPAGWDLFMENGANPWTVATEGALSGTGGSRSAQSGRISDNEWTELQTPLVTLTGTESLTFACYISSEYDYDGLSIWVYDEFDEVVDVWGSPQISGDFPVETNLAFPASHPDTIAVGASTDFDLRADYSRYGPGLDFLAPSSGGWNDIVTTDRTGTSGYANGDYAYDFGGTSASAPLAAGVGALVLSINPALTAAELRTLLRQTCDPIGGVSYDTNGWNTFYGHGRLNADRALDPALLRITETFPQAGDLRLVFLTRTNRAYRVESADSLGTPPVWTPLPGATNVTGTGGLVPVIDAGALTNRPQRLYRVRQLP
jgi:subtilisin family serine protease